MKIYVVLRWVLLALWLLLFVFYPLFFVINGFNNISVLLAIIFVHIMIAGLFKVVGIMNWRKIRRNKGRR